MRPLLFLVIAVFLFGVVCFGYGILKAVDDMLLLGVLSWVITLTLLFAWGQRTKGD